MTVLAWDGITLAADKRGNGVTSISTTTKIFRINDCLVGYTGQLVFGEQMAEWFKAGENIADFPPSQRDKDDWALLLVVRSNGKLQLYERTPYPATYEDKLFAVGSGADYALAAMHCGRTAAEAVALTCLLDSSCGNGVDTLTLVLGE
jgi:20S proteasome alpha/beta subunit